MKNTKVFNSHYLTLYQDTLLHIDDGKCISEITKDIGSTFSYVCLIVGDMRNKKILTSTKKGRTVIPKLTDKGKNMKKMLAEYKKALSCLA